MTDSHRRSTGDSAGEKNSGASRRHVLQGIGAAGVATAAISGSASAGDGALRTRASVAAQNDGGEEIPTSAQFWSFNELFDDDWTNADVIELAGEAGLDAYEPYFLDEDVDAMLEAEEEAGVYMSSAHAGLADVEADPEGMAETYSQFAHDGRNPPLIEAYQDGMWSTESDVIDFAERVNAAADEMADHDFEFGYHNHDHEFQYLEDADERAYDVFLEHVEDHVYLQLDVAWCFAGVDRPDPIEYVIEYGDKIKSLHMKNWRANDSHTHGSGEAGNGELTEIHEGDLNMRAIATAARNASEVDHLVYEYDNSPHPEESMEAAAEWLDEVNHPYSPAGVCAVDGDTHPAKLYDA